VNDIFKRLDAISFNRYGIVKFMVSICHKVYVIANRCGAVIILQTEDWLLQLEQGNVYLYMIQALHMEIWSYDFEFKVLMCEHQMSLFIYSIKKNLIFLMLINWPEYKH
jgi:hypothetical protein